MTEKLGHKLSLLEALQHAPVLLSFKMEGNEV